VAKKIEVQIVGDADSLSRALNKATGSTNKFGSALSTVGKAAVLGLGAVGVASAIAGKKMIDMASDAAEVDSKMSVIFGNVLPGLTKNLDKFAAATGASRYQLREQTADMGALLAPLLGTKQAAADMSTQFVKLATDIGSFNNVPVADALLAIRSGLVGESEPLRRFGVLLNEAAVKAEGLRLGLVKGNEVMTESEKVQARASLIMKQTALAQGDATRTAGSFANQMKALKNSVMDAGTAIGSQLIPLILPALQRFNGFLQEFFAAEGFRAKLNIVWEGIQEVAADLGAKLGAAIGAVNWAEVGTAIGTAIRNAIIQAGPSVTEGAKALVEKINEGIKGGNWDAIGATMGVQLRQQMIASLSSSGTASRSETEKIVDNIRTTLAKVPGLGVLMRIPTGTLTASFAAALDGAKGFFSGLTGITRASMSNFQQTMRSGMLRGIQAVGEAAAGAYAAAVRIGSQIVSGVLAGLGSLYGAVKSKIESTIGSVLGGIDIPGFSPPAEAAAKAIGKPLGQGVIDGWIKSTATLPAKMSASLKAAIEHARKTIEAARDRLATAFDGVTDRILRAFDAQSAGMETTHEKILREIDERRQMEDLIQRQTDAQLRLNEAIASGGDVAAAQRDLDRATEDIARVDIEAKAAEERKNLDSLREEQRIHLEKRLAALEASFVKEGASVKKAMAAMVKLMKSFGIDFEIAGALVGEAFVAGLKKSLGAAASAAAGVGAAVPGPSSFNPGPSVATGGATLQFNNYAPINSQEQLDSMVQAAAARLKNGGRLPV
jgi:hypothetical protein